MWLTQSVPPNSNVTQAKHGTNRLTTARGFDHDLAILGSTRGARRGPAWRLKRLLAETGNSATTPFSTSGIRGSAGDPAIVQPRAADRRKPLTRIRPSVVAEGAPGVGCSRSDHPLTPPRASRVGMLVGFTALAAGSLIPRSGSRCSASSGDRGRDRSPRRRQQDHWIHRPWANHAIDLRVTRRLASGSVPAAALTLWTLSHLWSSDSKGTSVVSRQLRDFPRS